MKIVMVGPVYPYKGGISHYTALMSKNLAKDHEVVTFSYSLQYPKLLYKSEQKDFDNDAFKIEDTRFKINTINPFSWFSAAKAINAEKPDLVIFQWWHPWFSPAYWTLCKRLDKNSKVLFLCHNVLPHEGFPLKNKLAKAVLSKGDYFIVHSNQDAEDLKSLVSNPNYIHTVLPTYNAFKIKNTLYQDARSGLGLNESDEMLLFFGFIREYKGLKHLIAAMPKIKANRPNAKLFVVGDFFGNDKEEYVNLIEQSGCKDSITLVDGYVPDKEVEPYFAASDVVVLPYESATQSAIVQIAYGFEKPVIATNVGGLPEVVIDGKTGYVVAPKDPEAIADAVIQFFSENKSHAFCEAIRAEAYKYSWDRMNHNVEKLMLS